MKEYVSIQGEKVCLFHFAVNFIEYNLLIKYGIKLKYTAFRRFLNCLDKIALINGGDGFSDIYGSHMFLSRLNYAHLAMKANIPLIFLPQPIGPFSLGPDRDLAIKILKYSSEIFVRDKMFICDLDELGVNYEISKDLSAFMKPESFDIIIEKNAVGINFSGLAYDNGYMDLAGKFPTYKMFVHQLIINFQKYGIPIYLIPHSYNYKTPEKFNDDFSACKNAYNQLDDKSNVYVVDKDLISPQVKYVISKMSFFIGTRMHANFAAIYTNVPVFGLSYSYKFAGAFEANGLSASQTLSIVNMSEKHISDAIMTIDSFYKQSLEKNV